MVVWRSILLGGAAMAALTIDIVFVEIISAL